LSGFGWTWHTGASSVRDVPEEPGVAIDPRNGDVVMWGGYGGDFDAGGPALLTLPTGDVKDFFVVKYSANGTFQWQKAIHASDDDDPGLGGIAIDSAGDIPVRHAHAHQPRR